jgi:hypothetical protein
MHRDLWILVALAAGVYLLGNRQQPTGSGAVGLPDPSNPGGYQTATVIDYCTANPSDPLCANTTYYGASVPGYDVCGTVAGQVC